MSGVRIHGTLQSPLVPAEPLEAGGAPSGALRLAVFAALFLVQISNAASGVITKVGLHGRCGVDPRVCPLMRDARSSPLLATF
eukprot:COSAG05_NODE_9794_length_601_cov_0.812749_1_plen_82_part_01